jgi:hypothetical protein
MSDTPPFFSGWIDDPAEVEIVAGLQPYYSFAETPAGAMATGPDHAYLWQAWERATGRKYPNRDQGQYGTCVSFGTVAAVEISQACESIAGDPEEVRDLATEVVYAGSRVEIGGGRFRSDGSIGAWAAEFVKKWGALDRGVFCGGKYDLTTYSGARARQWGAPGAGVPDDLEPDVRKYPVKTITKVTTFEDACKALAAGFAISVCSSVGFKTARDKDGFCAPGPRWDHCMALIGFQRGSRPGGFIQNSWGANVHTGSLGAGDPPTGGFWADADVVERMLKAGDSWAFSSVVGFPARVLPWFI